MVKLNLFFHVLVPLMVVGDMGKSVLSYWASKFCKGKWSKGEGLTKPKSNCLSRPLVRGSTLNVNTLILQVVLHTIYQRRWVVLIFCHVPFVESWKVCRSFVLMITAYNFGWVGSKWIINFDKDPKTVLLVKYIC